MIRAGSGSGTMRKKGEGFDRAERAVAAGTTTSPGLLPTRDHLPGAGEVPDTWARHVLCTPGSLPSSLRHGVHEEGHDAVLLPNQ